MLALLGWSVNRLKVESGTSLIWFSTLIAIAVSLILVLSSALHQYFFVRNLKDYLEQLTLSSLASWDGKSEIAQVVELLQAQFPSPISQFSVGSIKILPGPTLEITGCGRWESPLPVMQLGVELCQVALAR